LFTVAIGLGSNLGRREENLRRAGEFLRTLLAGKVTFSPFYESEPVGYLDQPWFLNQVCIGETGLPPLQLLFRLKEFEKEMGREPGPRFGPRCIDLDLLFYGEWVFKSHLLTIPHPRMTERSFVLLPLVEMGADWVHPELNCTVQEIWAAKKETLAPSVRLEG
jgi:2-amino-4-hydroxy-6-hydroxymethyldihydropteridine diphosphokinase